MIFEFLMLGMAADPGKLMLAGGGDESPAMIREYIDLCGGPGAKIVVLAQTRSEPLLTGKEHPALLRSCGAQHVILFNQPFISDAERDRAEREIAHCDGIFLPGGDQELFMERWGAPWLHRVLRAALRRGVDFFGTSAGSMLMSNPMIAGWADDGHLKMRQGIGLTRWLVDTHFAERNRAARTASAFARCRYAPGYIGLNEPDWIVMQNDTVIEKNGSPQIFPRTQPMTPVLK